MKISARNVLEGTVKSIRPGTVNTEVVIEIAKGMEVVSIITKASAKALGLEKGKSRLCGDQGVQCHDRGGLSPQSSEPVLEGPGKPFHEAGLERSLLPLTGPDLDGFGEVGFKDRFHLFPELRPEDDGVISRSRTKLRGIRLAEPRVDQWPSMTAFLRMSGPPGIHKFLPPP